MVYKVYLLFSFLIKDLQDLENDPLPNCSAGPISRDSKLKIKKTFYTNFSFKSVPLASNNYGTGI
jgi:hypothetical protein